MLRTLLIAAVLAGTPMAGVIAFGPSPAMAQAQPPPPPQTPLPPRSGRDCHQPPVTS
jgi:hypothetical protein